MTPEEIVRALAAADPVFPDDLGDVAYSCALCEAPMDHGAEHRSDCPWRLAVEWVEANRADDIEVEIFRTLVEYGLPYAAARARAAKIR